MVCELSSTLRKCSKGLEFFDLTNLMLGAVLGASNVWGQNVDLFFAERERFCFFYFYMFLKPCLNFYRKRFSLIFVLVLGASPKPPPWTILYLSSSIHFYGYTTS